MTDTKWTHAQGLVEHENGWLVYVDLLIDADGLIHDGHGFPLTPTTDTVELRGWGSMDGMATIYINDGGREIRVPDSEL